MPLINRVKSILLSFLPRHYFPHPSSPFILTHGRIPQSAVQEAIGQAKKAHPDAQLYLLTDVPSLETKFRLPTLDPQQDLSADAVHKRVLVLAYNSDETAIGVLRQLKPLKNTIFWPAVQTAPTARYFHRNNIAREVLVAEYAANLGKYDLLDFENILQALEITRHLAGAYVEIGVYRGDSAHAALRYLERIKLSRRCYFLDTYEGFNYSEAEASIDTVWKNTHSETSFAFVEKLLAKFTVPHSLHRCNIITNDLPTEIETIAVANIDVDMYEAVLAAICKVAPKITVGGIIICEDQGHTPLLLGAYLAQQEFLSNHPEFVPVQLTSGQSFLIRVQ